MSPIIATDVDESWARIGPHVEAIRAILEADVFEDQMAAMLRDYCEQHLTEIELGSEVYDRLASDNIISKPKFRELWNK
jgi:hypothetical protein